MEPRRLISFGNSSYIISLPKPWIKKHNLNKGDFVYCSENNDYELILTPQEREIKKELKTATIDVGKKTLKDIKTEIISSYINGYDIIKIQSQLPLHYPDKLRDIIRDLTTMDIVEQDNKVIIAKDFLNIEKISPEDLMRRIDLILRSMIADNKHHNNRLKFEKVYDMDVEINRITFMMFRFIKKALGDPSLARLYGLAPGDLLSLWLLVSRLEKVGDEVKRVGTFLKALKLTRKEFNDLIYLYSLIEKEYLNAMKAYYNKDRGLALSVAFNKQNMINLCNEFLKKSNKIMVGSVIEKFKGMEIYIEYIARAVHDMNIR